MEAIKQKVTGGAYEKPAKTADGAMTTQDSADAHTVSYSLLRKWPNMRIAYCEVDVPSRTC